MDNVSTELSLVSQLELVKEVANHMPVVLFTKESMDAYKPVPLVNIPPVRFMGGPKNQGRKRNI